MCMCVCVCARARVAQEVQLLKSYILIMPGVRVRTKPCKEGANNVGHHNLVDCVYCARLQYQDIS